MAERLKGLNALVSIGGKHYDVRRSTDLGSLPPEVVGVLRRRGALIEDDPPDAEAVAAVSEPATEPHLSDDVRVLIEQIQTGGEGGKALTVPQTVDLAGGDAERARRVREAEVAAHGGDGRQTALEGLDKIIGGG